MRSTAAAGGQDLFARPGWWDERARAYASLRAVNAVRMALLGDWCCDWFGAGARTDVVDLGCGGGLMAVPLAAAGHRVVAVDRCAPALREGHDRAAGVLFVRGDLDAPPLPNGCADLVLLCDVLEHVAEPARAVAAAARLLRAGGCLFVNTINRTLRARALAVWLGEGLGLIPRGTHDARLFVRPRELAQQARGAGLRPTHWCGEAPRPLLSLWRRHVVVRRSASLAVGYCAGFRKEGA